ncbi:MAG: M3 family metallopeptidase, partial [Chloroflexota bacterium]
MTETYTEGKWSLADLFPGHEAPEMKTAFEDLEARVNKFEGWREKLNPDMDVEDFMACVQEQEADTRLANRISQYAFLLFSEDTQDQEAQTFQAKVQQFMAGLENQSLFFSLWWKSLEDKEAVKFLEVAGTEYGYWLEQIRNFKPHTLTEAEEKIVNIKNVTGSNALQTLYSSITNRYVFKIEVDGIEKELTRDELMALVKGSDADLRARAYQELYRVYGEDGSILGQIYQSLVRDFRNENIDLRNFKNPISVRNLGNDVPDDVVNTLLDVAQKNSAVFQRFFKYKAKVLKVDKLRRYDIYAPVASAD